MTLERQQAWLKFAALVTIGFGVLVALATHPLTAGPTRWLADLILWPPGDAEPGTARETRLLAAIAGGVMAGWGVALWHLAGEGLRAAPEMSRRIIRQSVLVWFIIDSVGLFAAGAPLNVLGNLAFLALFLVPLRHAPTPSAF